VERALQRCLNILL